MILSHSKNAQGVDSHRYRLIGRCLGFLLVVVLFRGCLGSGGTLITTAKLQNVDLADVSSTVVSEAPIHLETARNEWTNFSIQLAGLNLPGQATHQFSLRVQPLNLATANAQIAPSAFSAFQVLNMPIDVNRAGYIRHTGLSASKAELPRALLPLKLTDGSLNLSDVRDPSNATDPKAHALPGVTPVSLWFDLHVPPDAKPGEYSTAIDILQDKETKPVASLPITVNVYDFVLSDERHLKMVGSIEWDDLARHYPERFENVTPRLLSRSEPRYALAIKTLDQLVTLAQDNRVQVVIPRLQPTVKWTAATPQFDWTDYDSIVSPWVKGDVFRDKVAVGYWPLPAMDNLSSYDVRSQLQYWTEAAAHFDQLDWLTRSAVILNATNSVRVDSAEALKLSAEASKILDLNQRLRVEVPLEDDQVQFNPTGANGGLLRRDNASRLITANPGLVFNSPIQSWPNDVERPSRWLRTDLSGLIPYIGAGGDERDVRLWAWLATVPLPPPAFGVKYGPVQLVRWPAALPRTNTPAEPADPNALTWFYPGSWFGVDEPVPSVQLKWLRRAQQDYEYLYLARERREVLNSLVLARLMSKPVELQPTQQPDPTFGLMSGTADPKAWDGAMKLLARYIMLREPGQTTVDEKNEQELNLDLGRWAEPQERPVVMGRNISWLCDNSGGASALQLGAVLSVDIYNDQDRRPEDNTLSWTSTPPGWHYRPQPKVIPQLKTYNVAPFTLDATLEPTEIKNLDHKPIDITFTDGFSHKTSLLHVVLPAAFTDKREGSGGWKIDGSLEDWAPEDLIQNSPLVTMLNRPALQRQEVQKASTPTNIYTAWSEDNFYVAFKLAGLAGVAGRSQGNDITYDRQRVWGEDLCEIVAQPVYADNTIGPLMHIVCKPNGTPWIERLMNKRDFVDPWQAYEGTGTRYRATVNGDDWRGEVAIPWKALSPDQRKGRPVLLRFNFSQHKNLTGESSSWAGPVDFGRDENFTGVLILRDPVKPGM